MEFEVDDSDFYWNESEYYSDWTLAEELNGPAISFFIALQFVLALPSNLFIVVHTVRDWKSNLKKSAVVLLCSLALSNLLMTILYMPFAIVASGAGEWIYGRTDHTRNALCNIHGFVFEYFATITGHMLVVISVDRFLFIVKASSYHKIMTFKVTLSVVASIWVLAVFWCLFPYYGVGTYDWSFTNGGCLSFILQDNLPLTVFFIAYSLTLLSIIVVTTIWTFAYTRRVLKKSWQLKMEVGDQYLKKQVYFRKVRSLMGIFGALLIANAFSWVPYFVPVLYSLASVDLNKIPVEVDAVLFILSLSNNVTNPVIQIYFRMDLRESTQQLFRRSSHYLLSLFETLKSDNGERNTKSGSPSTSNNSDSGVSPRSLPSNDARSQITLPPPSEEPDISQHM